MNTTGTARAARATSRSRPIRCCSAKKGNGRPSRNASTSPSRTEPSGSWAAAAAISGKRAVISSSPRDQIHTLPITPNQLGADAVPLPLDLPGMPIAELGGDVGGAAHLGIERRRQAERIRAGPIGGGDIGGDELAIPGRRRRPLAHQPRRHHLCGQPGGLGQRPDDQGLRHADPQLAGEQLEQREAFPARQLAQPGEHLGGLRLRLDLTQALNRSLDPFGQRIAADRVRPGGRRTAARRFRRRRRPPRSIRRAATRAGRWRP